MIFSFFVVLPLGPLHAGVPKQGEYEAITGEVDEQSTGAEDQYERDGLLSSSLHSDLSRSVPSIRSKDSLNGFKTNLARASGLFFP